MKDGGAASPDRVLERLDLKLVAARVSLLVAACCRFFVAVCWRLAAGVWLAVGGSSGFGDHDPAPIPPLLAGEAEGPTRPVPPGEEAVGMPAEAEATRRAPHGLRRRGTAVAHEAARIAPTAAPHLPPPSAPAPKRLSQVIHTCAARDASI
ncbi:hypothetical protein CCMA1212_003410 [Trichoderma ghanense]|uniref:Uncharacterized protein n=1 Tax=Trichoderma ghanense TaxID=65468 RepID=A0ABY2H901_9HYPO